MLLDIIDSFKADIATPMKILNSNFKTPNTKQTKDITSSVTSEYTPKFQTENQKSLGELTAKFRVRTVKVKEALSKKIQFNLTNMSLAYSMILTGRYYK